MTARLIADDLFAGAGGWDVAADMLDVHARGVENMPEARATRDAAGLTTIHDDVWTFRPRYTAYPTGLHLQAAGLIASPPCQTFSQAGKGSGRKALNDVLAVLPNVATMSLGELREAGEVFGDDRTALVLTPLWFALHHPYKWLAWEQVPTVLPVWEACAEVLREHGWHVWTGVLHAEQYGVPQTRKRAVLIANRDMEVGPPTPTHSRYYARTPSKLDPGVAKWVSMSEALGWPEDTHPDSVPCDCDVALHMPSHDRAYDASVPRTPCKPAPTMAIGNGSAQVRWDPRETTPDGLPRFAQQSDNVPDYTWPDNRPATVVAGRDLVQAPGATANRYNNSTKSRNDGVRVSVGEAGALQSFPSDFPWQGSAKSKQYLQAGNAVPVLLAMAVLCAAMGEPFVPPTPQTATDTNHAPAQPALAFN